MAPNIRSSSPCLSRLQTIHADLRKKKAALDILRKQVQRKEAEREAKIAYAGQRTKKSPKTFHRQPHAVGRVVANDPRLDSPLGLLCSEHGTCTWRLMSAHDRLPAEDVGVGRSGSLRSPPRRPHSLSLINGFIDS
jgi:hypothetical protein